MTSPEEALELEVDGAKRLIKTDAYPMSIGELTRLYVDGELKIAPAFQRFFRWTAEQKSLLVESLLIGIPIPPIFVAQDDEGAWDVVDGLQRLSTVFEVQGELRNADGKTNEALTLRATEYLPNLEGYSWDGASGLALPVPVQRDFKRASFDLRIVKRESSAGAKFDLFRRINSYGTPLTPQEMRTARIVERNPEFAELLLSLAATDDFVEVVRLGERLTDEQYDIELVLRFLTLYDKKPAVIKRQRAFPAYIDDRALELADSFGRDDSGLADNAVRVFRDVFAWVSSHGGADVMRRFDPETQEFRGGFLNTAFEVFILGAGGLMARKQPVAADLPAKAAEFWARPEMSSRFATGISTEARISRMMQQGMELLAA